MANNDASAENPSEARFRQRRERRPDMVKRRRDRRREQFNKERRNWLIIRVVAAAIVVVILLGIAWWGFRQWEQYQVSSDVTTYFSLDEYSIDHREGELLYEQIPPVGGPHNNAWQNCGFYGEPIYNYHGVHSLEHGAVWLTFDPELPQEDIDRLEELANQSYVLVSPYPGLEHPVVGSVWGKQIEFDSADDDRIEPFVRAYRTNPDNTPEPGAICFGQVDYTVDEGYTLQTEPSIISGSAEEVAAAEAAAEATPDTDSPTPASDDGEG
ncbi:hypothetical protein BH23CHL3_BH23CHL3_06940 [soil metagenome]